MIQIELLDSGTIDRIAAGEVVERPVSVVKELTENAIDAGASSITAEIRNGGKSLIRVTDNGSGIDSDMVRRAFERHSTSKLRKIEDLQTISTLGFRGEALSSIAAVSKVELMTKTEDALTGTIYRIEGGIEKQISPAGLPLGTTILVKDLFYHMPARAKFLKTDRTEGMYVSDLMEQMALSHPGIAFKFISDGKIRLQTTGNGNLQDVIYRIYGRRVSANLIGIDASQDHYRICGYLGKPALSRANRRFESVFVNGRYVKDRILQKGIEDGCKRFLMQHQFPFTVLFFETQGHLVDVNVHPAKALVRFSQEKAVYDFVCGAISDALHTQELIEEVPLARKDDTGTVYSPQGYDLPDSAVSFVRDTAEPYETNTQQTLHETEPHGKEDTDAERKSVIKPEQELRHAVQETSADTAVPQPPDNAAYEQRSLPIPQTQQARFRLIGSLFDTYWLLEFDGKFYMIDQHAAHERVNYEKFLYLFRNTRPSSQQVFPAIPVTLQAQEIALAEKYRDYIASYGFQIEYFGGNEYRITAVPTELFGMNAEGFFLSFLDEMNDLSTGSIDPDTVTDRLASAACKASIKGHDVITDAQAQDLLERLFECSDPYHCPHGRPTLISMTKSEIEKLFRRVTP